MPDHVLSEPELLRREELRQLRALGIEPYPAEPFPTTQLASELLAAGPENLPAGELRLAGRLMNKRVIGKASFAELQDESGSIQLYLSRDELCPGDDKTRYNTVFKKLTSLGDQVGVVGEAFVTQTGEITVNVREFSFLAKALLPPPMPKEKDGQVYDAFADPELRHRMRYVDLFANPHVRETFRKRSAIVQAMRDFMQERGYLEVETPILQPIYGGALARPFVTHHNALDMPLYLRIANELYLKKLIVGGFRGVFEFAKDFRNEGMSRFHNPEFTQMELYVAFQDYRWMMSFVEAMLEAVTLGVHGTTSFPAGERTLRFQAPFARKTFLGSIQEYTGEDLRGKSTEEIRAAAVRLNIDNADTLTRSQLLDEIFGEHVEPKLLDPTFIMDYPIEMSPLAKKHREEEDLVERFELIVNGKEIANAYSELNDPLDQRARLEAQLRDRDLGDEEAMVLDEDFLRALEYGMPPTTGLGIGIDRLAMILLNQPTIQEVLLFPHMRPEAPSHVAPKEDFLQLGIDPEWLPLLVRAGIQSPGQLATRQAGQLYKELSSMQRKYQLSLPELSKEQVAAWIAAAPAPEEAN